MTIVAKRVKVGGTLSDVELPDDPSDAEIIRALGGNGNERLVTHGELHLKNGRWETLAINGDTLVIGGAPYVSQFPKVRRTCDLTDEQVRNIVKLCR